MKLYPKNIKVEIIENKNLTKKQKQTINNARISNFGEKEKKDIDKDYEPTTLWFFVKRKNKIVSLGGLRPIKVKFHRKIYNKGYL